MPQISEWLHASGLALDLTVENIKVFVLYGLIGIAGAYYLLVALKSMLSRGKGNTKNPSR